MEREEKICRYRFCRVAPAFSLEKMAVRRACLALIADQLRRRQPTESNNFEDSSADSYPLGLFRISVGRFSRTAFSAAVFLYV